MPRRIGDEPPALPPFHLRALAAPPPGWPPDVQPGEIIRAAHINVVRDSVYAWPGDVDGQFHTLRNVNLVNATGVLTDPTTTAGDLLVRGPAALTRLPVGTQGQVLTVDTALPDRIRWAAVPAAPVASVFGRVGAVVAQAGDYNVNQVTGAMADPTTTRGDLIARGALGVGRLPVGTDGQVLTADNAAALGVRWGTLPVASVFGRTGAIQAQAGDYTAAMVLNAVSTLGSYPDPIWIPSYAYSKLIGVPAQFPPAPHTHDAAAIVSGVLATSRLGTGVADDQVFLRGDGTWAATGTGGGGAVISVFGRAGHVVAETGDYDVSQVTNALPNPTSAPGDLITRDQTGSIVRLPVGADGQVLQATTAGVRLQWTTLSAAVQTPWVTDIDANGFKLQNAGTIGVGNTAIPPFTLPGYSFLVVGPTTPSTAAGIITACGNTAAAGQAIGSFSFANYEVTTADKRIAEIRGDTDGGPGAGRISFNVWSAGAAVERARMTATGYPLEVFGDLNITGVYRVNGIPIDTGGADQTPWLSDIDGAGFTLRNAGAIGIGIGNVIPPAMLTLGAGSLGFAGVYAPGADVGYPALYNGETGNGNGLNVRTWKFAIRTGPFGNSTTKFYVEQNGHVGILTTVAESKLSFGSTDANIQSRFALWEGGGSTGFRGIGMANPATSVYGVGIYALSTAIPTDINMALFVRDEGNIGVHTTNPLVPLHVVGNASPSTGATAFRVQGSFGGGMSLVDGALEAAFYMTGGASTQLHLAFGSTGSALTDLVAFIAGTGMQVTAPIQPAFFLQSASGTPGAQIGKLVYDGGFAIATGGVGGWIFQKVDDAGNFQANLVTIRHSHASMGIGVLQPGYPLDVSGDCNISGTYRVNGVPLPTGAANNWVNLVRCSAPANLTPVNTWVAVPGCSMTLANGPGRYLILGSFDFVQGTLVDTTFSGGLFVNGGDQGQHADYATGGITGQGSSGRASVLQQWVYATGTGGETIELRAQANQAGAQVQLQSTLSATWISP
jgi:hypothetical protein